jgi:hypothetical protein
MDNVEKLSNCSLSEFEPVSSRSEAGMHTAEPQHSVCSAWSSPNKWSLCIMASLHIVPPRPYFEAVSINFIASEQIFLWYVLAFTFILHLSPPRYELCWCTVSRSYFELELEGLGRHTWYVSVRHAMMLAVTSCFPRCLLQGRSLSCFEFTCEGHQAALYWNVVAANFWRLNYSS